MSRTLKVSYPREPNSPASYRDPRGYAKFRRLQAEQRENAAHHSFQRAEAQGELRTVDLTPKPVVSPGAQRRAAIDSAVAPAVGIAGSAALLNPALVPVAAGLGIGYGVFKLGESLKLW